MKDDLIQRRYKRILGLCLLGLILASAAWANPTGPSVVAGGAAVSGVGTNQVTIQQTTPQAILSWQQFNIAPNEVTRFIQPSAQSIALNRIFDANPSQIFGSLQANGAVILLNPNGVFFGPQAQVNVSGLIASSLNITDADFLAGRYAFQGSPLNAAVRNAGKIETNAGGFVYLLAPNVENSGVIKSPEGEIVLAAGATAYLSNRPDGRGFLVEVTAPVGEAVNLKDLIADGGKVSLFGRVVNQNGLIQANSVREKNGRIELIAGERLTLSNGSRTVAQGESEGISEGGSVIGRSDKRVGETRFERGAVIDVSGGRFGGDGGFVELSGFAVNLGGMIKGPAQPGFRGGKFLLDPFDITVDDALFLQLSADVMTQEIEIQADHDITVTASSVNLGDWPTNGFAERTLSFQAGNDLRFDHNFIFNGFDNSGIKWNIKGNAGNDILLIASQLALGNGGGFDFEAGRDIQLETDLSTSVPSYLWVLAGGDIRLRAGRDIIAPSLFDLLNGSNRYSGIRLADISENLAASVGHLTIETGRDFLGGFILANGTATISTGGNFGRSSVGRFPNSDPDFSYANLLLGKGTIQVNAKGDIFLGRIWDIGLAEANQGILDPHNAVTLTSETGDIHLKPEKVTGREGGNRLTTRSAYYPPSFAANAEKGSIFMEGNLTFWPSLTGSLDFSARDQIVGGLASGGPFRVSLWNVNPNALPGSDGLDPPLFDPLDIGFDIPTNTPPASIRFHTQNGDISQLFFGFQTALPKQVEIFSGRDLKQFIASIMIPEGREAIIHAERDISMNRFADENGPIESGIFFYGSGQGSVYAGGHFDLGNSNGIEQRQIFGIQRVAAGLIDLSIGNGLQMTTSKIYTYAGASLSIHGIHGAGSPVGGVVDVGTNDPGISTNPDRGIATVGGGSIDITAAGDVNVNASRVATFGGGDIRITSTQGNINAGFGGANDTVELKIPVSTVGPDGKPVIDPDGKPVTGQKVFRVPGSGIFTFHDSDPTPLPLYPPKPALDLPLFQPILPSPPPQPALPLFPDKTPEMIQLEAKILRHRVIGHDTSSLEAELVREFQQQAQTYQLQVAELFSRYQSILADYKAEAQASYDSQLQAYKDQVAQLQVAANQQYEGIKAEHRKNWKLGDISLTASGEKGAIIVPPAGIRGKKISIVAKILDLQGGQIGGDTNVTVDQFIGDLGQIQGPGEIKVGDQPLSDGTLPPLPAFNLPTLPSFSLPSIPTGGSTGSAGLGGLSGRTGSISSASSSSVTTASNAVAAVQEKVEEQAAVEGEPTVEATATDMETPEAGRKGKQVGSAEGKKRGRVTQRSFQIRRGVLIQVELNEEGQ